MKARFTEGPIEVVATDPAEGVECYWLAMGGLDIGAVYGPQSPERRALAEAFARAPDMARLLVDARPWLDDLRETLWNSYSVGGEIPDPGDKAEHDFVAELTARIDALTAGLFEPETEGGDPV